MLLQKTCAVAARPHSMLILKVYMQKFETGGFVDPGIKSRFQTEAWGKQSVPPVFAFALLINGCTLPVSWFCPAYLLNLHQLHFWAIVISRPSHKVGSWGAASVLPPSLSLNSELWVLLLSRSFVMEAVGSEWLHGKCEPPQGLELWSTENNLMISICKAP